LSYALQDTPTAQRIGETLRAAGMEVWFDQSELRSGDGWNPTIRKQIKSPGDDDELWRPQLRRTNQS
jgi:TIR domain